MDHEKQEHYKRIYQSALTRIGDTSNGTRMSMRDLANEIGTWAKFAEEALGDGDVQTARMCIGVIQVMTER